MWPYFGRFLAEPSLHRAEFWNTVPEDAVFATNIGFFKGLDKSVEERSITGC